MRISLMSARHSVATYKSQVSCTSAREQSYLGVDPDAEIMYGAVEGDQGQLL